MDSSDYMSIRDKVENAKTVDDLKEVLLDLLACLDSATDRISWLEESN